MSVLERGLVNFQVSIEGVWQMPDVRDSHAHEDH